MEKKDDIITLVTVCDNHFAVLLAALIKSIEVNHTSGERLELYIVQDGISTENRSKIEAPVNREMITIHWLSIKQAIPEKSSLPLDHSSFPRNVYVRLFIPCFIPRGITKVLYLDADMIVKKDISGLWNTDLQQYTLAAVADRSEKVSSSWGGITNYRELGLDPETRYLNSGLLLLDPVKWREQNITAKIIDCVNANRRYTNFPDQYGLNVVFAGQWLELDRRWNTYSIRNEPDPYIIHFIGIKPIYDSYDASEEYRKEFFYYLGLTEWRDFKIKSRYLRLFKKLINKLKKKFYAMFKQI